MRFRGVAFLVLLVACSDDGSGPEERQFEGTWTGSYSNSASTVPFTAVMDLAQDGNAVTGTLSVSSGRAASVSGTVSGDQLEATFTYTDGCAGSATSTADLVDETIPPSLEGSYSSDDCQGETSGSYNLVREE
jgi:hypothetical protein